MIRLIPLLLILAYLSFHTINANVAIVNEGYQVVQFIHAFYFLFLLISSSSS